MVMCEYVYFVDFYMKSDSLDALRASIEDYCRSHNGSYYEGEYVFRLIYREGEWVYDDSFRAQIEIVEGKVIFRVIR